MVRTGLDNLLSSDRAILRGRKVGVVCHQASISSSLRHILEELLPGHQNGDYEIVAAFGPQHGIWGHTQDNMIEWEGYRDPRTGLLFHSLYGEHREPTHEMLKGINLLVIDLQDVGSRYYTFIWTMALCMKACTELGIEVHVLDRPNPLGGTRVEGPILIPGMESFVGLQSIATRHGLTIAEIARWLKRNVYPACQLSWTEMYGWERQMTFEETGLHWALPSPNMPTVKTAMVYPGMCLFEGTKLSEGRGTTVPFEVFGAPYIDGRALAESLNTLRLPGVQFRAVQFLPTFQKHAGVECEGCYIHVTDRSIFEPVYTGMAILATIKQMWPEDFAWQDPPYEYVWDRRPIDILVGDPAVTALIESNQLDTLQEHLVSDGRRFASESAQDRLY